MNTERAMVIVGAGHVGGRAAQALREFGWKGPLVLIGAEPHPPYERPPLSKAVLTGERCGEQCLLRSASAMADDGVVHRVAQVSAIDPAAREVVLADGRRLAYEALLLCTGGRLRTLAIPGADLPGVCGLRTLDDAASLARRLQPGTQVAIVGGGFIGLEVAASARARGCAVTLFEGAPRLLGRAVPATVAEQVLALHRAHGVVVRLDCVPSEISGTAQHALQLRLSDGSTQTADTVVIGIGIDPAVELAVDAGLAVRRGVVVDAELATSANGIFAAGDVAEFPSPRSGRPIRQETWHNAETQARTAAANMLGRHERYEQLPWFWSDQYDHQLQVAGEPELGTATVTRLFGAGARLDFYLDADGEVVGASGFGPCSAAAKEFKLARLLVERRVRPDPAQLADPAVKLKSLV